MSWLAFAPTFLTALGILVLPGIVLGWFLRLRGLTLFALAGPLSVSLIAVAAIGAGATGIKWSAIPVAALTVVSSLCALGWTRWVGVNSTADISRGRRGAAAPVVGFAFAFCAISAMLVFAIRNPEYFSQRYDNIFHLNAVRYVIETQNASPLWIGSMTSADNSLAFYPSGWHAVVSLISELSSASIFASTNAANFVVAAIIWPLPFRSTYSRSASSRTIRSNCM